MFGVPASQADRAFVMFSLFKRAWGEIFISFGALIDADLTQYLIWLQLLVDTDNPLS